MTKLTSIRPEFADRIPKILDDGVLYISEKFSTAAHNCGCGCGVKIVTPLKPGRWTMSNDGGLVSIKPSIGNWSSACQSHYWIEVNQIKWAHSFSEAEIRANRASDKQASGAAHAERRVREQGLLGRIWLYIKGWFGF
jgi:hypothetical protein